ALSTARLISSEGGSVSKLTMIIETILKITPGKISWIYAEKPKLYQRIVVNIPTIIPVTAPHFVIRFQYRDNIIHFTTLEPSPAQANKANTKTNPTGLASKKAITETIMIEICPINFKLLSFNSFLKTCAMKPSATAVAATNKYEDTEDIIADITIATTTPTIHGDKKACTK